MKNKNNKKDKNKNNKKDPKASIPAAKPVVKENEIAIRQTMRVTMSCDHRVVDGATGAKFLQTFKQIMENPLYLFVG